jgi:type 1 fimbria pilin
MNKKKIKWLLVCGFIGIVEGWNNEVQAACRFSAGSVEQRTTFNMGIITAQRDTPAGTVLAEVKVPQGALNQTTVCTTGSYRAAMGELRFTTMSAYGNGVYNTNIPGVGIRMYTHSNNDTGKGLIPSSLNFSTPPAGGIWVQNGRSIQLVKTSSNEVGAGAITTGIVARGYITSPLLYYATMTLTGGTIVRAACTVTTTSIPVPLGQKKSDEFTGIGHTTTDVPFKIPLDCNANTRVKVTIDGTADSSGVKGVIALSPSSTETVAKGVGVQILYNNAPITLGSLITVGTAAAGTYEIPLIGRYYQTASKVNPGRANATATFTMTYN